MTWGDGVMALLTAASVVVAALALGHARRATSAAGKAALEAAEANRIAKESNKIAVDSNGIAARAAQDARDAPVAVAWDELVAALAAVQAFDAASNEVDVGPYLTALRTRATLLVDRVPWDHFDEWLAAEQVAGVMLMRDAAERGNEVRVRRRGNPLSPEEALALNEHFHLWAAAYTKNLRLARKTGPAGVPFGRLTEEAWKTIRGVCVRNGWPVPTGTIRGLAPLDA
ncbi:hypothetical protein GCM10027517_03120 [Phycicoccus ginsengisoli]